MSVASDTFDSMIGMGSGPGRYGILGVESSDPVLSLLSALGLAQTVGTALVIDMRRDLLVHGDRTLADVAAEGPSIGELSPGRSGVALMSSGPLAPGECRSVIEALGLNWPAIVIRCDRGHWEGPTVPVRPLLHGLLRPVETSAAVWQPVSAGVRPSGPGPVLPRLGGSLTRHLLAGRVARRSRWVRAWGPVWGLPWA